MEDFKKVWPDIVKLAEDTGVRIGIENCPMFFTMDEWPVIEVEDNAFEESLSGRKKALLQSKEYIKQYLY